MGLLPAAGLAKRLAPLPCSKEILPIGFWKENDVPRCPKVVCHYLLERMQRAGVRKVFVIVRKGKWDIPAYLGDGRDLGLELAYLVARLPYGPPFTLDQAYPFVRHARVVLGFPDILFDPEDAFVRLLERQTATGADVVLGLFPTSQPSKVDMVELDAKGRVLGIVVKPARTSLHYAWIIAVWSQAFTEFLHARLQEVEDAYRAGTMTERSDFHVGELIQTALQADLHVDSVLFPGGSCLDIGSPEDLLTAMRRGGNLGVNAYPATKT